MKVYKVNNKKSKFSAIAVCLLLTAMLAIGGTLAYLFTHTDPVVNTFNPVDVDIEIVEKLDGNIKNNVQIGNTGTTDAFIRAKVVFTWQNEAGDVYPEVPAEGTDYTITWSNDGWVKGSDGFYYHTAEVSPTAPNNVTKVLFTACTPKDTAPSGYTLHVEILSQSIQSTPDEAVESVWTLVNANDGVLTLK